jgi:hypothetical protein
LSCAVIAAATAVPLYAQSEPAASAPPSSVPAEPPEGELRMASVFLLPTLVIQKGAAAEAPEAARPADAATIALARRLDAILSDGVQDLGLTIDLSDPAPRSDRVRTEIDLVELGSRKKEWVVSPSIEPAGRSLIVRIVAVPPGSKVAIVRSESVTPGELAVRGVVMLKDVTAHRAAREPRPPREGAERPEPKLATPTRSPGRATLALNAALFGGMVGYSIQRASDSDDPRILYPLMALGTGFGLGLSQIIAEEWDVGVGDAWYMSAGAWWPGFAGYFWARGQASTTAPEQYGAALIGAGVGLGLATTSLAVGGGMSEGGALMTHSGGAFGTFFGALVDYAVRGTTDGTPWRGLGYGAAIGVVSAGLISTRLRADPGQVLIVDLGAGLGALAGAAATSPFIFKSTSAKNERIFLISTMGASAAGGVVAWLFARRGGQTQALSLPVVPYVTAGPYPQLGAMGRF